MPIRVGKSAATSVTFTTPQEVIINHADDSIQIYGNDGVTDRPILTDSNGAIQTISNAPTLKVIVDEASSTVLYVGEADPGDGESTASWRIKRITETGAILRVEWADGNSNFDNVWIDRVSLSYS